MRIIRMLCITGIALIAASSSYAQSTSQQAFGGSGSIYFGAHGTWMDGILGGVNAEFGVAKNIGIGLVTLTGTNTGFTPVGSAPSGFTQETNTQAYGGGLYGSYHYQLPSMNNLDLFGNLGALAVYNTSQTAQRSTTSSIITSDSAFTTIQPLIQVGARYRYAGSASARLAVGFPAHIQLGVDWEISKPLSIKTDADGMPIPAYGIFIGGSVYGKSTVNLNVAKSRKTDLVLHNTPDYGLSLLVPFTRSAKIGVGLDVSSSNWQVRTQPEAGALAGFNPNDTTILVERYNYTTIFPHINLYGAVIGVAFGQSGTMSARNRLDKNVSVLLNNPPTSIGNRNLLINSNYNGDYSEELEQSLTELRAGFSFPAMDEDYMRINFNILVSYPLKGMFKNDGVQYAYSYNNDGINGYQHSAEKNVRPISMMLGLSILFKAPIF